MNPSYLDFLTRLKNASLAGSKELTVPSSRYCLSLSELLKKHHYIEDYSFVDKTIKIIGPKVKKLTFFSTPGRRFYQKTSSLPWGTSPQSLIIISTSSGLMSQKLARKQHLGGEIVAEIN